MQTPIWVAAANPDIRALHEAIQETQSFKANDSQDAELEEFNYLWDWNYPALAMSDEDWVGTPLLRAIKHNHIEHVQTLLDAGADPNGVDIRPLLVHASRASRAGFAIAPESSGKERKIKIANAVDVEVDVNGNLTLIEWLKDPSENAKIMANELVRRVAVETVLPFWSGHCDTVEDLLWDEWSLYGNTPVTSLTLAAACGLTEMIDLLLTNGADASHWLSAERHPSPPDDLSPSMLSFVTPIHAAIWHNRVGCIRHLVSLGFSPNAAPAFPFDGGISPLAYSILLKSACPDAFDILLAAPGADCSIHTRYLDVSLLHFAAAMRDRTVFEKIEAQSLSSSAGTTALGQTLLHVACLPEHRSDIKSDLVSKAAIESMHDCVHIPPLPEARQTVRSVQSAHQLQCEMVNLLLRQLGDHLEGLRRQDIYGNTPLHYLAAAQEQNDELVAELRGRDGVEGIWTGSVNKKGYTAADMYQQH